MRKLSLLSTAVIISSLTILPLTGCSKNESADKADKNQASGVKTDKSTNPLEILSYAQGYQLGSQLPAEINTKQLSTGIDDGKAHKDPLYTQDEIKAAFENYQKTLAQKAQEGSQKNDQFLAENAKKPDIKTTASGLQYQILKEGTGKKATASSTVKVNYEGKLIDGTVFDSTFSRNEPVELSLGSTIPGWIEGLPMIKEGGSIMLYVPAKLGYGDHAVGSIPANSVLIFKVELLQVK
ncbi:hypothetical protein P256_02433 [Acinetobacter nectaris CIP 110549]|uniref:Peptidyl-prolyl cis-trans isomerase n=1 Tax=Acinetobacter nectaris CIP 110549 TaxID=1392540 RepID=V2TH95_9GAMM|nr:FKBP-type peptidyl-prolyl cis-trans isomerase [Acinetobacter nectaris]ESK36987.1 hypothetical protein P256_02433 [Acinetobacter nectaris CIP 110549]